MSLPVPTSEHSGSPTKPTVLILNASLGGQGGNTAVLLARAQQILERSARVITATLDDGMAYLDVKPHIAAADAILIGTGTHWDSWSHRLQKFLEDATPDEGTDLWLGKPVGLVVTMHSVGGKGVLSRLQGVLTTFGCTVPPMSGMVYSAVNQATIEAGAAESSDIWSPEDLEIVCHNVLAALHPKPTYKRWPVERTRTYDRWIRG